MLETAFSHVSQSVHVAVALTLCLRHHLGPTIDQILHVAEAKLRDGARQKKGPLPAPGTSPIFGDKSPD